MKNAITIAFTDRPCVLSDGTSAVAAREENVC